MLCRLVPCCLVLCSRLLRQHLRLTTPPKREKPRLVEVISRLFVGRGLLTQERAKCLGVQPAHGDRTSHDVAQRYWEEVCEEELRPRNRCTERHPQGDQEPWAGHHVEQTNMDGYVRVIVRPCLHCLQSAGVYQSVKPDLCAHSSLPAKPHSYNPLRVMLALV